LEQLACLILGDWPMLLFLFDRAPDTGKQRELSKAVSCQKPVSDGFPAPLTCHTNNCLSDLKSGATTVKAADNHPLMLYKKGCMFTAVLTEKSTYCNYTSY